MSPVGNQNDALYTVGPVVEIDVTPTLTVHATYASGDYVGTSGTAMVFANAARQVGGSGKIRSVVVEDNGAESVAFELWLFDAAITPPADSAAWAISDADAAHLVGVISLSTFFASSNNTVTQSQNPGIGFKCGAASQNLYGCLVTRGAPTYASGDLTVRLVIEQD